MVREDHRLIAPERDGDPLSFLDVVDDAPVVLIKAVILEERACVLGQRVKQDPQTGERLAMQRVCVRRHGFNNNRVRAQDMHLGLRRIALDPYAAVVMLGALVTLGARALADLARVTPPASGESKSRPGAIFIGHGKNKGPLGKIEKLLSQFKIPYKVAVDEPNLGRPIPIKVCGTMMECGSAILIFTKAQKFHTEDGTEVWRPSENVVHELGASSLLYEDRIVIFKEQGLDLASNFSSIGYIEFDEGAIEAKTAELLSELIGFGLVKITAA